MSRSPDASGLSPSSSSTSPSSATLRTPPYTPVKPSYSPRSPHRAPPSESPTSSFLASALGGLSLRDSQTPLRRGSATNGGTLLGDSTNKGVSRGNSDTALGLSGMVKPLESQMETRGYGQVTPSKTLKPATSVDELAMLAVSSSITELSMSIQEVSTSIFEIQELRHASSISTKPLGSSSATEGRGFSTNAVSEMDKALMNLDAKLEEVRRELADIESRVQPLLANSADPTIESTEVYFLREKWKSTLEEWDSVQKDAEMLGEEMKEDKWLVVFNSVIKQAEDMMVSLEKILNQSHQFVWDVNRPNVNRASSDYSSSQLPGSASGNSVTSLSNGGQPHLLPGDIQPLLSSFIALHRSLHAKVKYYSPACDRVLKILGKGIADRSTKNGQVLRRFAEMKSRWKELQERIARVEAEMSGVEDMLREAAGPDEARAKEKEKEKERDSRRNAEFGNTLTPPRESPVGRISPLRRLANKISPNSTPTRPDRFFRQSSLGPSSPASSTAMLPSTSATSSSPSASSSGARPTPPRPPKSNKRVVAVSPVSSLPPPQTPQSRPPLSHRRSSSALSASVGASGRTMPRRAISPMPPTPSASLADRPRWNPSTKRTDEEREVLTQSALGKGRPSLAASGGGGTPLATRNGRNSAMGLRASSRLSMNSSMSRSYSGARPVSPAFSDASSAVRERPSTPSRIPRPSSVIRPRSTTPYDSANTTTIMQRMASSPSTAGPTTANRSRPPVASNRYSLSRSTGPAPFMIPRSSSASLLPTSAASNGLSPPRAVAPSPSATSSSAFLYRGQTPEPSLMAHAQRLANVRANVSRPPPVPRLPSNRQGSDQSTPRANVRPVSSLAYDRAGAFSPLPNGESTATAYSPNPHDPLDIAVGEIVNSLPLALHVDRVDPHLSRAQAGQLEVYNARYLFSLSPLLDQRRAVMLKLVDRVGPRARKGEKKVLARVGGGWQDLESHCLSLMAHAL